MKPAILLTGATGLVGASLLRALIEEDYPVICLARPRNGHSPAMRIQHTLAALSPDLTSPRKIKTHVETYCGDITQPQLGLSLTDYRHLARTVTHVFHSAAAIRFAAADTHKVRLTNIGGTDNLLAFLQDAPAVEGLHYIGTAYIAGDREDRVYEDDTDKGQTFNNAYEESKFVAELRIREFQRRALSKVTIYRPGIIVGDYLTGTTIRFNTMYQFLKVLHVLKSSYRPDSSGRTHMPIRVLADPRTTKNFVPIDYVVKLVMKIFSEPRLHGKTYHLVNHQPPTMALIREVMLDVLQISGPTFVPPKSFQENPPDEIERVFIDETKIYTPYLLKEPAFDNTHVRDIAPGSEYLCPPMDREALLRLFEFAVHSGWGRNIWKRVLKPAENAQGRTQLIRSYFNDFLPSVMGRSIFADLDNLNACIGFLFTDSREKWTIEIKNGKLQQIRPLLPDRSQVNYELGDDTFAHIISGTLTPQEAFFTNKSKIKGDALKGLKLAAIFDRFIKQYPYQGHD
ncbi:MAG: SDR family oxidoreductase [Thermodesulfobacteriota bacterium]